MIFIASVAFLGGCICGYLVCRDVYIDFINKD